MPEAVATEDGRTGRSILRRVEAGTVVSFNHAAEGLFQPRGRRPFGYLAGAVVGRHSVNMLTAEPSASMAAVLPVMCAWAKS